MFKKEASLSILMLVATIIFYFYQSCGIDKTLKLRTNRDETPSAAGADELHAVTNLSADQALQKELTIRVNQTTAYATLYIKGRPVSKWKVATGRVQNTDASEVNPPDGSGQNPTGVFAVHELEACPPWSARGKSFGGCDPANPLGSWALWFQGTRHWGPREFGLHGVDAAHLDSVTDSNTVNRRRSSGCIRNHPKNIAALFELAKDKYVLQSTLGSRTQRFSLKPGAEPVFVVSSNWQNDPAVPDVSGLDSLIPDKPQKPITFPSQCLINVNPIGGLANVRKEPNTESELLTTLKSDEKVTARGKVTGSEVQGNKDWISIEFTTSAGDKFGAGVGKASFVHVSVLSCE